MELSSNVARAVKICIVFSAPFLLVIFYDQFFLGRTIITFPDVIQVKGLVDAVRLTALDADIFMSHHPRYFVSLLMLLASQITNPLEKLSLGGIESAWLIMVIAFLLCIGLVVGRGWLKYHNSPWLIFGIASIGATMSSMIRYYPIFFSFYLVGIIMVACAALASISVKSKFEDSYAVTWLFLLAGFSAGMHFGTIFILIVLFSTYFVLAAQKRRLLLFKPHFSGRIWTFLIYFAVATTSIAVFSTFFNLTYSFVGRLSYVFVLFSLAALIFEFWFNRGNYKKIVVDILVATAVQVAIYSLAKWVQIATEDPSVLLPHALLSAFPAFLLNMAVRLTNWHQKLVKGPAGIAALGVLASASYGTPFLLAGTATAAYHLDKGGFGQFENLVAAFHCSLNWELVMIIISCAAFVGAIFHQKLELNIRVFATFSLIVLTLYSYVVTPGVCQQYTKGEYFGMGSRVFLFLLFFTPSAFLLVSSLKKFGATIGSLFLIVVYAVAFSDFYEADWAARAVKYNALHSEARKIIKREMSVPHTKLVCRSRALEECVIACAYLTPVNNKETREKLIFKQTILKSGMGVGEHADIEKIQCQLPGASRFSSDDRLLLIADNNVRKYENEGWSLLWSREPSLYIFSR
jgi:hypothetical protein